IGLQELLRGHPRYLFSGLPAHSSSIRLQPHLGFHTRRIFVNVGPRFLAHFSRLTVGGALLAAGILHAQQTPPNTQQQAGPIGERHTVKRVQSVQAASPAPHSRNTTTYHHAIVYALHRCNHPAHAKRIDHVSDHYDSHKPDNFHPHAPPPCSYDDASGPAVSL